MKNKDLKRSWGKLVKDMGLGDRFRWDKNRVVWEREGERLGLER